MSEAETYEELARKLIDLQASIDTTSNALCGVIAFLVVVLFIYMALNSFNY